MRLYQGGLPLTRLILARDVPSQVLIPLLGTRWVRFYSDVLRRSPKFQYLHNPNDIKYL